MLKKRLFEDACRIEIEILKEPIGKQDHIPAIYGGIIFTKYFRKLSIKK